MHSRIFEITEKPLEREEYATSGSFDYDEITFFADYVDDERVDEKRDLEFFDAVFTGIFERKGRELTLCDLTNFMELWRDDIKKRANNINFLDWRSVYDMKSVVKRTHLDSDYMLYNAAWGVMYMGDFVQTLFVSYKPGHKFYIGGIIDYHF